MTKKPYRQFSGRYWKVSQQAKKAYSSNEEFMTVLDNDFMQKYFNTNNGEIIKSLDGELIYPKSPEYYFEGKTCFLIGSNRLL